jgi:ankyrin repeat protein
LLYKGANINVQDESGNTPLHYAAANGKKDMVALLLENQADPTTVNTKEQKAIDYANIKGFNEITELLLKYGPANSTAKVAEPVNNTTEKPASGVDKKQALLDLKELLDAGILTQEEFNSEKTKILQGN